MVGVTLREGAFLVAALGMVALLLVGTVSAAAPGLDFSDDRAPNPTVVESELVVAEHDRAEMDSPLDYYDDDDDDGLYRSRFHDRFSVDVRPIHSAVVRLSPVSRLITIKCAMKMWPVLVECPECSTYDEQRKERPIQARR